MHSSTAAITSRDAVCGVSVARASKALSMVCRSVSLMQVPDVSCGGWSRASCAMRAALVQRGRAPDLLATGCMLDP